MDVEGTQLAAGLRRLIKRERRSAEDAARTERRLAGDGLRVRVYQGAAGPGVSLDRHIVFAARDEATLDEAFALEERMLEETASRREVVTRFGELLGYPACCAEAFAHSDAQDDATHVERLARAHRGTLTGLDNWVSVDLRPYSHFPCAPGCDATRELAEATLEALAEAHPTYASEARAALSSVAFARSVRDWALLLGARREGERVRFDHVLSADDLGLRSREDALADPGYAAFWREVVEPLRRAGEVTLTATEARLPAGPSLALGADLWALDFSG